MARNSKQNAGKSRAARTGPSKPYLRLLEGRINSKEYTDQIKKSVSRTAKLAES